MTENRVADKAFVRIGDVVVAIAHIVSFNEDRRGDVTVVRVTLDNETWFTAILDEAELEQVRDVLTSA